MADTAIRIKNLGKKYFIGQRETAYKTLRESIMNLLARRDGKSDTIWALKDISFEVERGEVVGIIGRNGAGKSTLLKILSHITEPTEGYAEIHGRVGSLLEVGTGFHPELTGSENIFLNGAILGMRKAEIRSKFDEIVAFAEIEKFMDTPVKRYSSGMRVRLAFAVAAHLEPEILLVDEVLAVGDAAFQKKCLGKMGEVAGEGRTVLFVSHNMVAMQGLCPRVIWINDGRIVEEGQAGQVISNYLQTSFSTLTEQVWDDMATAPGNSAVRLRRVCVRPVDCSPSDPITMQTPFVIEVEFWNLVPDAHLHVTLHLFTEQGIAAFSTASLFEPVWGKRAFPVGLFHSVCYIPCNLLNTGRHWIRLLIVKNHGTVIYKQEDALSFEVMDSVGLRGAWYGKRPGVVHPILKWTTDHIDSELELAPQTDNEIVI